MNINDNDNDTYSSDTRSSRSGFWDDGDDVPPASASESENPREEQSADAFSSSSVRGSGFSDDSPFDDNQPEPGCDVLGTCRPEGESGADDSSEAEKNSWRQDRGGQPGRKSAFHFENFEKRWQRSMNKVENRKILGKDFLENVVQEDLGDVLKISLERRSKKDKDERRKLLKLFLYNLPLTLVCLAVMSAGPAKLYEWFFSSNSQSYDALIGASALFLLIFPGVAVLLLTKYLSLSHQMEVQQKIFLDKTTGDFSIQRLRRGEPIRRMPKVTFKNGSAQYYEKAYRYNNQSDHMVYEFGVKDVNSNAHYNFSDVTKESHRWLELFFKALLG